ncbi:hypothetical protein BJ742DRAFT_741169 [Cladochytrium replicatum]|nr:hypothetical protein BJ742DRAFT_741169 [Cladochytrium replicatum]
MAHNHLANFNAANFNAAFLTLQISMLQPLNCCSHADYNLNGVTTPGANKVQVETRQHGGQSAKQRGTFHRDENRAPFASQAHDTRLAQKDFAPTMWGPVHCHLHPRAVHQQAEVQDHRGHSATLMCPLFPRIGLQRLNCFKASIWTHELTRFGNPRTQKQQAAVLWAKGKQLTEGKKAEFFMNDLNKHLDDIKKGKKKEEWESYLYELVLSDEATDWDDILVRLKGQKVVKILLRKPLKRMRTKKTKTG